MEMEKLETVREVFRLQKFHRREEFSGAQPEFRVLARAIGPFAAAFAEETRPHANERLDAELP
jgi:hypothetical protein